jgi:protein TonB
MILILLAAQGVAGAHAAPQPAPQPGIMITNSTTPQAPLAVQVARPPSAIASAAPGVRIVRPPQERGTAQSYVSRDDYPAAARDSGAEGTVRFRLTIDPAGRVIGCDIKSSSGSAVLDMATCNLMRRRARFTPAIDSNGNPGVGTIEQVVVWKRP